MSEWISVEDELPDMGLVVLVWGCDESPTTAYRTSSVSKPGFLWRDYQDLTETNLSGITHWMTQPLPPNTQGT